MAMKCGIVGLPNVGKSTTFNALTKAGANVANYPFCTIEPNSGVVEVPEPRLGQIAEKIATKTIIPTTVEFVDIAGLVRGASKGEGLGNQFLGNIRNTQVIIHVVRCFANDDIIHVEGSVDALRDIETINTELMLSDLEALTKRKESIKKMVRAGDKKAAHENDILEKVEKALSAGVMPTSLSFTEQEDEIVKSIALITLKPVLYVCNVNEDEVVKGNAEVRKVEEFAKKSGQQAIWICAAIESEIVELEDPAERRAFLESLDLQQSGLEQLAQKSYKLLGLQTYFTAGEKEVRAWTFKKGFKAPQAAGVIHTDFERGFIRAETYHFNDLMELGSEKKIKEAGRLRIEGKDYVVQDGDIMHFLFNV